MDVQGPDIWSSTLGPNGLGSMGTLARFPHFLVVSVGKDKRKIKPTSGHIVHGEIHLAWNLKLFAEPNLGIHVPEALLWLLIRRVLSRNGTVVV